MSNYTEKIHPLDVMDLMTPEEFIEDCECGCFIDYDGYGHPVKDGYEDISIYIYPSALIEIPLDATHINWYNR